MNRSLKAVIVELTGGNVRNCHIYLRGADGFFPDDAMGGSNNSEVGKPTTLHIGGEVIETDIDRTNAIFRERKAIRLFFERHAMREGDLVLLERTGNRSYEISKASKRGLKYYL